MANEIILHGTVGSSYWSEACFTAAQVREQLDGMSGPVTVRINSGGGMATEGQAIYTLLKDYAGEVNVVVDAVAASAASLIAMAGDTITMRDGAWMLVHDPATPWLESRGTEDDHLRVAKQLGIMANGYAAVYAKRTGTSAAECRRIMKDETVMDGEMAVLLGFATHTEDTPAETVAAFKYDIYRNAPQAAKAAHASLGEGLGKEAILASIAGAPRTTSKQEALMANETKAVGATPAAETTTPAQTPATEVKVEEVAAAPVTAQAAILAERGRVTRITAMTMAAGLPAEMATDMIEKGLTLEAASDLITAKWKEKGDVDKVSTGVATARITRDERETKREGISMALVAQLGRTNPEKDVARPFMSMSIVEMAADMIGYKGSLRTAGDRERVFEMSMHGTSDFPLVFENALNKRMQDSYLKATPTYREIATQMDFTDMRPHPVSNIGDFPALQPLLEAGEIQFGTVGEKREVLFLRNWASGIRITRQMLLNDEINAIDRVLANRGTMVALDEDRLFYGMFLSGTLADGPTLLETTRQVFSSNAADNTKASVAAAITVDSLSIARAALRSRRGIASRAGAGDGQLLNLQASILLVGPQRETQAQQILAPIQAAQAGNVNVFSNSMRLVVTPYITDNAWYVFTDPNLLANFAYGFLQGASGPRMRMDEPFGVQGMAFTVEHDFGFGAIDGRGGFKNAGA